MPLTGSFPQGREGQTQREHARVIGCEQQDVPVPHEIEIDQVPGRELVLDLPDRPIRQLRGRRGGIVPKDAQEIPGQLFVLSLVDRHAQ